ncbi:MAG TPA: hypothetical protein VGQ58_05515 [Candidatus Limnocylindrales bacterium]|jgi:hypothetical protein|nr:hypothetical protein [Candidatus Limnocylindrales bacterium]
MLEAQVVERDRPTDGEQDRAALDRRAVVEVDDVRAVGAGVGPRLDGPDFEPNVDARCPQPVRDRHRIPRMVCGGEAVAGLDDRRVGTPKRA